MKKAIIIGSIVIALGVLGYYLVGQVNRLKDIKYSFGKPKINALSATNVGIELPITITNTSDADITLKSANLKVYVNGAFVSDVKSIVVQKVAKNNSGTIWANINFTPKDVLKGVVTKDVISSLLIDKSNIKIRISGFVNLVIADNLAEKVLDIDIEQPLSSLI